MVEEFKTHTSKFQKIKIIAKETQKNIKEKAGVDFRKE
jgi:TolB-like protein